MAVIVPSLPNNLTNGTTADATQVMANFNAIVSSVNSNAANSGVNTNISQITGLTSPLSPNQGGTGLATLPANGVMLGEGTNNVNVALPGASGTVLMSNGTGIDPSFQYATPPGAMIFWPTASVPTGFIEANGQSTAAYPNLSAIYGANVPDMRGVFPRGWDHGRGLDPYGTGILGYHVDTFASHNHGVNDPTHVHNMYDQQVRAGNTGNYWDALMNGLNASSGGSGTNPSNVGTGGIQGASTGISIQNNGSSETAPKYMAWMCIIKT